VGNPPIEREMQVISCPTLLPTIKTYVSTSQFPLSLQGLKQAPVDTVSSIIINNNNI
jgi:hypothetical protein